MPALYRSIVLLILSCALAGCAETQRQDATGKGSIRGYNALADSFNVNFLIEERSLGVLEYKDGSPVAPFDDLTYSFNFDIAFAGEGGTQRIASVTQTIVKDTDYVFVLAGTVATPEILVWEQPTREWGETETVFEMAFAHLGPTLGPVDVYYALTGTAPVLGNAIGTLAFGERLDEIEFAEGQYELLLTAPNDPSTVVPVSYKVAHELRAEEAEPKLADLVVRLSDCVQFHDRKILYSWIGATRRDWRGQGHFRALSEEQEAWALDNGFDEIVVKTKNKFYAMRSVLDHLEFDVVKYEVHPAHNRESKVYLSKRLGREVLGRHR